MIKILILFLFACTVNSEVSAQGKKDLKISLGTGFFNSTYYTNAKTRPFYNFGLEYQSNSRHSIAADYISGQFWYYDSVRPVPFVSLSTPGYENYNNVVAISTFFSVIYKYKFLERNKLSMKGGTGIGILTQSEAYAIQASTNSQRVVQFGGKPDLCFPLRLDLDYQVSKFFQIGIIAGTYVYPDYPLVGEHLGLRVSYILK